MVLIEAMVAAGGSMGAEPLYQVKLLSALRNGEPATSSSQR
jgi:hypothetical protein